MLRVLHPVLHIIHESTGISLLLWVILITNCSLYAQEYKEQNYHLKPHRAKTTSANTDE